MNKPVIALFPEASFGSALNCVGIAQQLLLEGAEPVFLCHPGFNGVFAEYGFREYQLPATAAPGPQTDETWQDFVTAHVAHFNQDPMAQLSTYVAPTWEAIVDTAMQVEEGLGRLLKRIKPSGIVLDNVIMFPAVANAGVPWVRVVSCTETEIPDENVPPYLSGMTADDPARPQFEAAYLAATQAAHRRYNAFRRDCGLAALPQGQFLEASPRLNLLLAPSAIRHSRRSPLPAERFVFLEGCVRKEAQFDPPPLPVNEGPMIYLSFGSLGAIDTGLISRMLRTFAEYPARFFVNVGAFLESYSKVPDNVFLGSWFPQPSIVSQADLFIHHGGNNSFCEAMFFGVPSLIMPYCWDGHDNATRAEQTGTGAHMHRDKWSPKALADRMTCLLADDVMLTRLRQISGTMQERPGTQQAARSIMNVL
ncbi:nucleotide disphospho-sugar-binding domain-containing protein [Roseobacter ponti]|uniref:Glycosyltransferase n=1 Tax=Roseobacter ponti TaxID=1891787 RepID=A0A858SRA0_9RHOB|nr:glycosyltransferase [Roseobacter ponti]QJF50408.1 glycosyltransferase [Roseobacter ponti]